MDDDDFSALRAEMVDEIAAEAMLVLQEVGMECFTPRVMDAMGRVPRHAFVPVELQPFAYLNRPLPIGYEKTISQPFIVALMTDLLQIEEDDVILEIGTGLGYQAAILSLLGRQVYTIEMIEELAGQARHRLASLGCGNVEVKVANGCHGWAKHAPFDKIIVTAAPDLIPPSLINQLRPGGRMVIPAGLPDNQKLLLVAKNEHGMLATREILPVRFSQLEENEPPTRV
jgi:protein-L-isoaspartate(D-aspartate) O-methyltransferase